MRELTWGWSLKPPLSSLTPTVTNVRTACVTACDNNEAGSTSDFSDKLFPCLQLGESKPLRGFRLTFGSFPTCENQESSVSLTSILSNERLHGTDKG